MKVSCNVFISELIKLQEWVKKTGKRVAIMAFEGRDAAGKGGAISRIISHLTQGFVKLLLLVLQLIEKKDSGIFKDISSIFQLQVK